MSNEHESTPPNRVYPMPFIEMLGIRFGRVDAESAEAELDIRPDFLNSGGNVHGGLYASFADTLLGAAIFPRVPRDRMAVTLELSCRYLRTVGGGTLRGIGRPVHVGGRTAVAEAEVWAGDALLVKATGTFMLIDRPGRGEGGA